MAGGDRRANREAGHGVDGRGRQRGVPLPRGQEPGGALPRGQQAAAALPRGHQAGAALPRGEAHPAASRPRALQGEEQVKKGLLSDVQIDEKRKDSSDNKEVIIAGTRFKSEYSLTKMKNQELLGVYAEMQALRRLISCKSTSTEKWSELFTIYSEFSDKVTYIREEIKANKGMPLPLPKPLSKKLRQPRFED